MVNKRWRFVSHCGKSNEKRNIELGPIHFCIRDSRTQVWCMTLMSCQLKLNVNKKDGNAWQKLVRVRANSLSNEFVEMNKARSEQNSTHLNTVEDDIIGARIYVLRFSRLRYEKIGWSFSFWCQSIALVLILNLNSNSNFPYLELYNLWAKRLICGKFAEPAIYRPLNRRSPAEEPTWDKLWERFTNIHPNQIFAHPIGSYGCALSPTGHWNFIQLRGINARGADCRRRLSQRIAHELQYTNVGRKVYWNLGMGCVVHAAGERVMR